MWVLAWSLGVAQGLSNLLRGVPHCISRRQISLPSDLLASTGLSEEAIFRKECSKELAPVILRITDIALANLDNVSISAILTVSRFRRRRSETLFDVQQ